MNLLEAKDAFVKGDVQTARTYYGHFKLDCLGFGGHHLRD